MEYITERITNIADLEQLIDKCSALAKIIEKEVPNNEKIKKLVLHLQMAAEFEIRVEQRKIHYCE